MTPTLLHAVARKAEAITPDADLLARYARERDHAAFEELVRRHGPLVWAVCRQMLPHRADAEDAFQAVFLAAAWSASCRDHSRRVYRARVAARGRQSAHRDAGRRLASSRPPTSARTRCGSTPEAERPVPDVAWGAAARRAARRSRGSPAAPGCREPHRVRAVRPRRRLASRRGVPVGLAPGFGVRAAVQRRGSGSWIVSRLARRCARGGRRNRNYRRCRECGAGRGCSMR